MNALWNFIQFLVFGPCKHYEIDHTLLWRAYREGKLNKFCVKEAP